MWQLFWIFRKILVWERGTYSFCVVLRDCNANSGLISHSQYKHLKGSSGLSVLSVIKSHFWVKSKDDLKSFSCNLSQPEQCSVSTRRAQRTKSTRIWQPWTAKTSSFLTSWTSVCIFPYLQIFVFTFVKVPDRELISDNSSLYYCVITENKFLCMLYLLHIWIFYWMKTTKSKNQERKIPLYVFSGVNSVLHNFFEFVSSRFLWFHFFTFSSNFAFSSDIE